MIMGTLWWRSGLAAFCVLTAALSANLLLLQPSVARRVASANIASIKPQAKADGEAQTASAASAKPAPGSARDAGAAGPSRPSAGGAEPRPLVAADSSAKETSEIVKALQRELNIRGYEAGTPDGVAGLVTRAAVMGFEYDHGLPLTAEASEGLLKGITSRSYNVVASRPAGADRPRTTQAEHIVRTVQQALSVLGYMTGRASATMDADTVRAIREFEMDQSMPETGRISGNLVARLVVHSGHGRLAAGR